MTEPAAGSADRPGSARRDVSTIRGQLVWAVIFPLIAFGLITILVITGALTNVAQNLILQRNTSTAQVAADHAYIVVNSFITSLKTAAQQVGPANPQADLSQQAPDLKLFSGGVALIDSSGKGVAATPNHPELVGRDFKSLNPDIAAGLQSLLNNQAAQTFALSAGTQNGRSLLYVVVPETWANKKPAALLGIYSPDYSSEFQLAVLPSQPQIPSDSHFLLLDTAGNLIGYDGQNLTQQDFSQAGPIRALIQQHQPASILAESVSARQQLIISYAPVGILGWGIVLEEPWQSVIAPAAYYEGALGILLALGIALAVIMLSISIQRVIRPLADLSNQADQLGPGSIFHPIEESGPVEVRALFHAFNQMVIRLAEQQSALRQYAEKALLSQEEERQRISHELHDETVQDLVGLVQRVDLCRDEIDTDPALARRRLDELSGLAEQALDDLRRISNALRPPVLQDLGLATAVQSLCDDFTQHMPGLRCNYEIHGEEGRLPPELELAIFRVIQEALSNIRRHSHSTSQVDVTLEIKEPTTVAKVRNNGPSFPVQDVQTLVREGHLGLAGMYERARLFNGEISITSIQGEGTTITLSLPVQPGTITYPLNEPGPAGEL